MLARGTLPSYDNFTTKPISREWHWGAVIEPRHYRLLLFGGLSATREITRASRRLYNPRVFTQSSVHNQASYDKHQTATSSAFGNYIQAFTSTFLSEKQIIKTNQDAFPALHCCDPERTAPGVRWWCSSAPEPQTEKGVVLHAETVQLHAAGAQSAAPALVPACLAAMQPRATRRSQAGHSAVSEQAPWTINSTGTVHIEEWSTKKVWRVNKSHKRQVHQSEKKKLCVNTGRSTRILLIY